MLNACREFGLGVFLSVAILSIAWFLLKKTFENHVKEREALLMTFNAERGVYAKLIDESFRKLEEASKYQREEHIKMMDNGERVLNRFDAHELKTATTVSEFLAESRMRSDEHKKMIEQLHEVATQNKEITAALGRLNGYRHEAA